MSTIRLEQRSVLIDGQARLIAAGEIHYFRLSRADWRGRLELLVEAGADTVATYIPWVVHERGDGRLDLTGRSDDTLDLGAFIDLAADLGLQVLLRPGPFVMAEMAGEGVPDRVRREHPEVAPIGWHGHRGPTGDLDYLAPAFLAEVKRWYDAVGEIAGPRMATVGGPVIAVQLDNEIGMLAWVSNTPQLTDAGCADLLVWLETVYNARLMTRYPGLPGPWSGADTAAFAAAIRQPDPSRGRALRIDLGQFFRSRFSRYVDHLVEFAEAAGMGGVPFLINIHGTSAGSGQPFPIGLSQVVETFAGRPGFAAGSDHYLGDLSLRTAADLHLMNAFMAAASGPDQPGMTLEFEAGSADYGDDLWNDTDPSAVVLKTRLSLAQGHRLLNYYLFAGGRNFVADPPRTDGTTRFAITGERHGFAAPVDPEGRRGRTFDATSDAMHLLRRLGPWLADAQEDHDDVALGMVLDDYLTEYRPPRDADPDAVGDLEYGRGAGPRGLLGRVLLTLGFRYGAVDLQSPAHPALPFPRLVVLGSPPAADRAVQQRLVDHLHSGGSLLLLGALPTRELDGTPCTVLADAMGVRVIGEVRDGPGNFLSVTATWGHGTERRVGRLQLFDARSAETFIAEAITGATGGFFAETSGGGRAVVIGCDFGADLGLFATAMERLGATAGLHHAVVPGLLATTTTARDGSRLLHLLNVSGIEITSTFTLDGAAVLGGSPITLAPRTGLALPIGVLIDSPHGQHLLAATAEIAEVAAGTVRLCGPGRAWVDGVEIEVSAQGTFVLGGQSQP